MTTITCPFCDEAVALPVVVDDFNHGPFDADELIRWAENYGHPEQWAKKAQQLHGENEELRARAAHLGQPAESSEPAKRLRRWMCRQGFAHPQHFDDRDAAMALEYALAGKGTPGGGT